MAILGFPTVELHQGRCFLRGTGGYFNVNNYHAENTRRGEFIVVENSREQSKTASLGIQIKII